MNTDSDAKKPTPNFIRDIINKDISEKKHSKIVTRFPPEPNGYLHIGHAKSICLNFGLAEDYNGLCNLRFDDTNPEKEEIEYINSIREDVKWLGFEWNINPSASDYFDQLYLYAVDLISKGLAYVDSQNAEQMRSNRGTLTEAGIDTPFRNRSIE